MGRSCRDSRGVRVRRDQVGTNAGDSCVYLQGRGSCLPGGLQLAFIKVYLFSHHCLACASLLSLSYSVPGHMALLTAVLLLALQNGFAIIRPPGHHAEESTAM